MPAYYRATLIEFLADDPRRILGTLTTESAKTGFTDLKQKQTNEFRSLVEIPNFSIQLKKYFG